MKPVDLMHAIEKWVYDESLALGYKEKIAINAAEKTFYVIFNNFKTSKFYIPTAHHAEYKNIYSDFTGSNHHELAIKYKKSLQQIYNIVRKQHDIFAKQKQQQLFSTDEQDNASLPQSFLIIQEHLPLELTLVRIKDAHAKKIAFDLCYYLSNTFGGLPIAIPSDLDKKMKSDNHTLF